MIPRLRRWMLWGVPALLLSRPWLGLFGWMALGAAVLPAPAFPTKKRPVLHRLFFAWAVGSVAMAALTALTGAALPWRLGHACFCVIVCQRALDHPLPQAIAWSGGAALCLLLIFLR